MYNTTKQKKSRENPRTFMSKDGTKYIVVVLNEQGVSCIDRYSNGKIIVSSRKYRSVAEANRAAFAFAFPGETYNTYLNAIFERC